MNEGLKLIFAAVIGAFLAGVGAVAFVDTKIEKALTSHTSDKLHQSSEGIIALNPTVDLGNCNLLTPSGRERQIVKSCDRGYVMVGFLDGHGHSGDSTDTHTFQCCAIVTQ